MSTTSEKKILGVYRSGHGKSLEILEELHLNLFYKRPTRSGMISIRILDALLRTEKKFTPSIMEEYTNACETFVIFCY